MSELTGGCACGAVRFELSAAPMMTAACHCTDCQKSTGGGPNYVALFPAGTLTVTKGEPRRYVVQGESGGDVARAFCADCGTPLFTEAAGAMLPVKLGSLDDASAYKPALHVFTRSAPSWHPITEGLPAFETLPG